jgi:hypothetical protein
VSDLRAIHAAKPDIITFGFLNYKGTSFPGELDELFFETNGTNANSIIEDPDHPGTFIDTTLNDKNKEVWKLLAQLNSEGIFDKEAFSKDNYYHGTDDFATGKTAVVTFACPNTDYGMYNWLWSCIVKNYPNAKPEDFAMLPEPLKGEYKECRASAWLAALSSRRRACTPTARWTCWSMPCLKRARKSRAPVCRAFIIRRTPTETS